MQEQTPTFLMEESASTGFDDSALSRLTELVSALKEAEHRMKEAEQILANRKEEYRHISETLIPNHLLQFGISEIKLDSTGEKIKVDKDLNASVDEESRFFFFKFLRERGEDDIVKNVYKFDRMPTEKSVELEQFLESRGYSFEFDKNVHWQTQKKYFKELTGFGLEPDDYKRKLEAGQIIRREDLPAFVKLFEVQKTKIIAPRKSKI